MYTCEDILGMHSASVDFIGKAKKFLETQKTLEKDQYERDLHDIAVSLERLCRECSVDQIRQLNAEIAEVKKWISELDRKAE